MRKKGFHIAVVGATGAVGTEMMNLLEERKFPVASLHPLASERSLGKYLQWKGTEIGVEVLDKNSFKGIDIAFFSAGGGVSKEFVPHAVSSGALVIDNTSAFRTDPKIPLVVPEVNPHRIADAKKGLIIANPNCSTIQMVVVLKALSGLSPIKRVVVSTYQSVSGAGMKAMEELSKQSAALFAQKEMKIEKFPHRIAFNCIPHIDVFEEDGYTKEERKMINETVKIMEQPIAVTATTVRVPVFYGHSESVNVEFASEVTPEAARQVLKTAAGVMLCDDPSKNLYPMATMAAGTDPIYVGRIRKDSTVPFGLNLWIVADNIRKGAALNAVQIAEQWIQSL